MSRIPVPALTEEDFVLMLDGRLAIAPNGTRRYYNERGQLHRIGGPAILESNGLGSWWRNNKFERWHWGE